MEMPLDVVSMKTSQVIWNNSKKKKNTLHLKKKLGVSMGEGLGGEAGGATVA